MSRSVAHAHHTVASRLTTKHPYQIGYVTTDLDQAIASCARELDAREFTVTERDLVAQSPRGPLNLRVRFALGFVGDTMVEFIDPISGDIGFYSQLLPETGFGVALHHFGYLLDGDTDWAAFRAGIEDSEVVFELTGDPRVVYLDTRASLGHYLEYLQFSPEILAAWLARVPRND